ncbi:hypothetical protein FRX31_008098, partial [Thalictrum thalictroides]
MVTVKPNPVSPKPISPNPRFFLLTYPITDLPLEKKIEENDDRAKPHFPSPRFFLLTPFFLTLFLSFFGVDSRDFPSWLLQKCPNRLKKSKLDEVKMFRVLYGGTWEEGPPHLWPVRKYVPQQFRNGKVIPPEWVDDGMTEFLSFNEGVPEFVGNSCTLFWLWGKQRYSIVKDLDLIFFWDHAPANVDGYTEIIIDISPVVQLGVDSTYHNGNKTNDGTTTDCEQMDDVTVETPRKTRGKKTKGTPRKRIPIRKKKATPVKKKAHGGDQCEKKKKNKNKKKKLPVKRKVHMESDGTIDVDSESSGDGEWNHDADETWDWDSIAREKGPLPEDVHPDIGCGEDKYCGQPKTKDVEGQASQEAFDSAEYIDDEPRHDEGFEDVEGHAGNTDEDIRQGEGFEDVQGHAGNTDEDIRQGEDFEDVEAQTSDERDEPRDESRS